MRVSPLIEKVRAHDPNNYALHRAIRVAVVIPSAFAFSFEVIGDPVLATFTAFGCFALLLFVDFPGSWTSRLTGYALLAATGCALITLGTLASQYKWVAVASMTVVGFVVLFAGSLSAAIAAASRAALLTFILPVTLPAPASEIGPRLAGFGIAVAVAVPVAMLVWPPREHDQLRRYAADTCDAIADVVTARAAGLTEHADVVCERLQESLTALRRVFRGTAFRPVGLTTGSRALVRLVDELEWLGSIVVHLGTQQMHAWPALARNSCDAAADVLRVSAGRLRVERRVPLGDDDPLPDALERLAQARLRVSSEARALLDPHVDCTVELPYQGHEISYAASLVGATVQWAAEADTRPVIDRVLGRQPERSGSSPLSPAVRIATSHFERHSVWLQNSIRGAVGLGLAVLLVESFKSQHAFWAVLGALSVLRSSALSTGSTALRALLGTVVGFVIGGALVLVIGTSTPALWVALPIALLVAGYAPEAISFAAGQAAFTVVILILFNIIQPVGWKVGLVRIEDVAIGCGASLVVGLLLWPRGASAAISTALSEAYQVGAAYLQGAVDYALRRGGEPTGELRSALAAGRRLDDALRQYLAERGAKNVPLRDLTMAANGATRLRLAGEAISELRPVHGDPQVHTQFATTTQVVWGEAISVHDWYSAVAAALDLHGPAAPTPEPRATDRTDEVVSALQRDLVADVVDGGDTEQAKRLLWTSLYLQDMRVLESRLGEPIAAIPRSRQVIAHRIPAM